MKIRLIFFIITFAIMMVFAYLVPAVQYTYTTFDYPGAYKTKIIGINDADKMVGWYEDATGILHGFLYDETSNPPYITIDYPNALATSITDINDFDRILGKYEINGIWSSFIYDGISFTPANYPGAENTCANGINNSDKVSGVHWDVSSPWRGFICDGTDCTTFDYPDGPWTEVFDINNADTIVGWSGFQGYVYDGITFTSIDYPNAIKTRAMGINDADIIVGWYQDATDHGFLYDGTSFATLDYPGASWTQVVGINNANKIVGWYEDATGVHGFIATCLNLPARIDGTSFESYLLQDAYDAAGDGDTIQSQAIVFTEGLYINDNKEVYLESGYDCDYNDPPTGKTVLKGNIIISDGKLTIESGIIEAQ